MPELDIAKGINAGLVGVLASLMIEHVKAIGGEPTAALMATRKILDASVATVRTKGTTPTGETIDVSADMQRRIGLMLDEAENNARRMLHLPPSTLARQ
jgi:hypothetical protein